MDISKLPAPKFLELDVDIITTDIITEYERLSGKPLYPAQADRLMVDVIAYREMLIRNEVNEAAKQNLLAFPRGVMLDYLGDFFGVVRLENETDEQLHNRIELAPESYATTGSRQAYRFHTLSTDAAIIDCDAVRGDNGNIYIYILTSTGTASTDLIQAVLDNTSDEKKRPLSDRVDVIAGQALDLHLKIKVTPLTSANPQAVLDNARVNAQAFADKLKVKLGQDIVPSQIIDTLSDDNVWQIEVIAPAKPLMVEPWQWANITDITVTLGAVQDG